MSQFPRNRNRMPILKRRLGPPRRGSEPNDQYLRWLRKQACAVCGTLRWVEAAHVGLRGLDRYELIAWFNERYDQEVK
jgi:hypothetical protein